jgi:hypothetical protein
MEGYKMVRATDRVAAAVFAVSVTVSIVWGMANLGYPAAGGDLVAVRLGTCLPS